MSEEGVKTVFVTPHTHWDREWYLSFQSFRFKLVKLVDELLTMLKTDDQFFFTFDGQTIVLEDYFEIRPERKEEVLDYIRAGRIIVGPWYLLPDIWLVGEESLIRNLEYSYDLSTSFDIPLMNVGYLPDMFGHSNVIPQLLGDLTYLTTAVVWRGVPLQITEIPFKWKGSTESKRSLIGIYLPFGYGNASGLPDEEEKLQEIIPELIANLDEFTPSTLPVYLLHYGTDHQVPSTRIFDSLKKLQIPNMEISIGNLSDYVKKLTSTIESTGYQAMEYIGEFRSPARAHLLQDTYSARMWIKQWNQKLEDLLVKYAEPLSAYCWWIYKKSYPSSFLLEAWRFHLHNQPHDSICGCSIDQTHLEMKTRYTQAVSIVEAILDENKDHLAVQNQISKNSFCLSFNPTNTSDLPALVSFSSSEKTSPRYLSFEKNYYEIQEVGSSATKLWEMTTGPFKLKNLLKLLPRRQIMGIYLNEATITDKDNGNLCQVRIIVGDQPVGDFDVNKMKNEFLKLIEEKNYKKFHILVTKEAHLAYTALVPLNAWAFTKLRVHHDVPPNTSMPEKLFEISKDRVENEFYTVKFTKNGTFDLYEKQTKIQYKNLHFFEDWGDRGDEYTFGRLGPEFVKVKILKRKLSTTGPVYAEIEQTIDLELYEMINESRQNRIGKVTIPVSMVFRFYRDIPRIDIKTELINLAQDHRLRVCFPLPFEASQTKTSTHFGTIKRLGVPEQNPNFLEEASGIQPQKAFIRIDDPKGKTAVTLINKGLPEVELVNKSQLSLTLLRAIGWLSRSDIPERPEHAGPYLATPGAQEINETYIFEYSIWLHKKSDPLHSSYDQAELFTLPPTTVYYPQKEPLDEILIPMLQVFDPAIRISSLRLREKEIWATVYNISAKSVNTFINVPKRVSMTKSIRIDGTIKETIQITDGTGEITFDPHEIKILSFNQRE